MGATERLSEYYLDIDLMIHVQLFMRLLACRLLYIQDAVELIMGAVSQVQIRKPSSAGTSHHLSLTSFD